MLKQRTEPSPLYFCHLLLTSFTKRWWCCQLWRVFPHHLLLPLVCVVACCSTCFCFAIWGSDEVLCALLSPCCATAVSHHLASCESCVMSSLPVIRRTPRLYCTTLCPCSAANLHHFMASLVSCTTPVPFS